VVDNDSTILGTGRIEYRNKCATVQIARQLRNSLIHSISVVNGDNEATSRMVAIRYSPVTFQIPLHRDRFLPSGICAANLRNPEDSGERLDVEAPLAQDNTVREQITVFVSTVTGVNEAWIDVRPSIFRQ
jgi:hypothetical protein